MAKVVAAMTMSLDGFVAHLDDGVEHLFDWYENGEVLIEWPGNDMVSKVSTASAGYLQELIECTGALVVGRRVFDYTNGWGGHHPFGVPVYVITHTTPDGWPRDDAQFTFVNDGVETAVAMAREVAGEKSVGLAGPNIIQQCLNAGLVDELRIELVPVLLGEGVRLFDHLDSSPMFFSNPTVLQGNGVVHLIYEIRRDNR
ncbi:MAG: dihydrofolate reductase family protein [Acidimicrobiales bacterium]